MRDWTFGSTPSSPRLQETNILGDKIWGCVRFLSQSVRHHEFDCWYTCSRARLHILCGFSFSIEGYFLRVELCQISSRIWAGEFDTKMLLFLFWYKIKNKICFCCKMHMQIFCTEVTILPQVELLPVWKRWGDSEVCRNRFEGFTITSLF